MNIIRNIVRNFELLLAVIVCLVVLVVTPVRAETTMPTTTLPSVVTPTSTQKDFGGPPLIPASTAVFNPYLRPSWNLIGNPFDKPLDIAATFGTLEKPIEGVTLSVNALWAWNAKEGKWRFFSPQISAEENVNFARTMGYEVATQIAKGEGFWVDASSYIQVPKQVAARFTWTPAKFAALPIGWNLLGATEVITPREFNLAVNPMPVPFDVVPTDNFQTFWKWYIGARTWGFYAPSLEVAGWQAVQDYVNSKRYYDATWDQMQSNGQDGFWVNKTSAAGISVIPGTPTALVSVGSVVGAGDVATFSLPFKVTAGDNDIYIGGSIAFGGGNFSGGENAGKVTYATTTSTTSGVMNSSGASFSPANVMSGDSVGVYYKVLAGTSRIFTLSVAIKAAASGFVGVAVNSIAFGFTPDSLDGYYTEAFKTSDVYVTKH